jgi:hypothetical protein
MSLVAACSASSSPAAIATVAPSSAITSSRPTLASDARDATPSPITTNVPTITSTPPPSPMAPVVAAPSTDWRWTDVGTLTLPRKTHTATVLADGRLLVAGGYGAADYIAIAELYDPVTPGWRATGPMATPRAYSTGTLLPDGRVLVAGGARDWPETTAELFDPRTGSWAPTGAMGEARARHTATLLLDGRVLVVGGTWDTDGVSAHASAELFDPASGTWSLVRPMAEARANHSAMDGSSWWVARVRSRTRRCPRGLPRRRCST